MQKTTILVVDDITDTRELCRFMLERAGFTVITAHDAYVAYGLMAIHHPDVVIVDIMMPEMSGLELTRIVRRSEEFRRVRIIALTAYNEEYLEEAKKAGADAVLHKPEGFDILIETVGDVLYCDKSLQ